MPVERRGRADRGRVARRIPARDPERAARRAADGGDAGTTSRRSSRTAAACAARATARCAPPASRWSRAEPGPRYGPPDASRAPRYTGIRTFARCPHVTDARGVDAAVVGVPFDTATSNRPGRALRARGDPLRSISLRPYHPALDVDVFARALGRRLGRPRGDPRAMPSGPRARSRRGSAPLVEAGRRPDRARRRPLDRARRAARPRGTARSARAGAARRPRRHLGRVLRRALLPRHALPARGRGRPAPRPSAR